METMSAEQLATMMKPEPFVLAALHDVVMEAVAHNGHVRSHARDILVEHGLAICEDGHWRFSQAGVDALTEADRDAYYEMARASEDARRDAEMQAKESKEAEQWVERGVLAVENGIYRLTAKGKAREGDMLRYSLNRKGHELHFHWASFEGVRVGKEYAKTGAVLPLYMESGQWTRAKKRILASLTDSERELLFPDQRVQKPLSKAEQLLKDMLLAACQKVKEG